jgi:hypothetical protein
MFSSAYFPKVGLSDLHPACVYHLLIKLLIPWTTCNLYETWYAYFGNWVHLNVSLHKSLPSVCVCMSACVFFLSLQGNGLVKYIPHFGARQRLGKHIPRQRIHARIEKLWHSSFSIAVHIVSKESRRLVLHRTSCLSIGILVKLSLTIQQKVSCFLYTLNYLLALISPVFLSSPIYYRMMCRGLLLTPSPTNKEHK